MARAVIILIVMAFVAVGAGLYIVLGHKQDERPVTADLSQSGITAGAKSEAGNVGTRSTFDPDKELQANELIVINPPANFTDTIRRLNFTLIERFTFQGLGFAVARLRTPSDMQLPQARGVLAREMPGVVIDYNHRYDASQDPRRAPQSTGSAADQLQQTKKPKITSFAQAAIGWRDVPATCGKGIKLGMIDSGIDTNHPVLKGQDIEFRSFHSDNASMGDSEHGTAVAALLVGKPADSGLGGLLPGATLKAANMFEKSATGANSGNVVSLLRGLDWLVREKVSVINMSIAGSNNAALERGIAAATERSVLVVAAAGNWGRADKPAYPAALEQVFAVTAVDSYEGIYEFANTGAYIDFAAPGVNMVTAAPGGGSKRQSGTSFAAPFVTAYLALEIANGRGGTPAMVQANLNKLSKDLGPSGRDATFGAGEIQTTPKCPGG